MNIIAYINKAEKEAFKQHIRANTVLINKQLAMVEPGLFFPNNHSVTHMPPMICGLAAYLTDELPENFAFSIFEGQAMPKDIRERIKRDVRRELMEELRQMTFEELIHWIDVQSGC